MTDSTDTVRLDLGHPTFSPEIVAAREAMAPMVEAAEVTVEGILAAASEAAGLDDFGVDIYREPLGVLCEAVAADTNMSAFGRFSVATTLTASMRNRLLVEDLLARHPEIHDIDVVAPMIIVGLPRTGTTHLHNLISADPALRSLPYWESVEPVPPLAEQGVDFAVDPRYERCAQGLGFLNAALPHFKRMHDMYPEHVHEEIQLLAVAGSTMLFETMGMVPGWRDWYLSTDQTPWYEYCRTILKVLQFLGGGERWILKSPQHLEQFRALRAVFPDATFIVTHRDPVSITASFGTMSSYSAWMSRDPVDPHEIGGYWADRIERMLRTCVADRDLLPTDSSIDVVFHEFMADDIAMVERIYDLAGQPFTADSRAAMEQFMVDHPRGKHGRVDYHLEDLGLDRAERRAALDFYVQRFGVQIES